MKTIIAGSQFIHQDILFNAVKRTIIDHETYIIDDLGECHLESECLPDTDDRALIDTEIATIVYMLTTENVQDALELAGSLTREQKAQVWKKLTPDHRQELKKCSASTATQKSKLTV